MLSYNFSEYPNSKYSFLFSLLLSSSFILHLFSSKYLLVSMSGLGLIASYVGYSDMSVIILKLPFGLLFLFTLRLVNGYNFKILN